MHVGIALERRLNLLALAEHLPGFVDADRNPSCTPLGQLRVDSGQRFGRQRVNGSFIADQRACNLFNFMPVDRLALKGIDTDDWPATDFLARVGEAS